MTTSHDAADILQFTHLLIRIIVAALHLEIADDSNNDNCHPTKIAGSGAPLYEIELDVEDMELDKIEKCPNCHIGTIRAIDIDLNFRWNKWRIYNDSS